MKTYPSFKSLGVLFEQPRSEPFCIWWCCLAIWPSRALWRHAMRPSLQHCFQNGGRSNCSGAEVFAVTIRLKGKFTSKNIAIWLQRIMCFHNNQFHPVWNKALRSNKLFIGFYFKHECNRQDVGQGRGETYHSGNGGKGLPQVLFRRPCRG